MDTEYPAYGSPTASNENRSSDLFRVDFLLDLLGVFLDLPRCCMSLAAQFLARFLRFLLHLLGGFLGLVLQLLTAFAKFPLGLLSVFPRTANQ